MKLLIAMQYFGNDFKEAMEVSKMIADIEPHFVDDVDFLFSARFDSGFDQRTVDYVSNKFRTLTRVCKRREVGWPAGPNAMWHDLMCWTELQVKSGTEKWDAVLTMESDCVPMAHDWINQIMREWTKAGKFCLGCVIDDGGAFNPHLNGNAMFDPQICGKIPNFYGTPFGESWDTWHRGKIIPHTFDSPLFVSMHGWRQPITEEWLYKPRLNGITPCFFHGVKHDGARKIVRDKLGLK